MKHVSHAGRWWPFAIVGVFVANAGVMAWVMVTAHSDHSFAIEEDYYEKALHWDDSARRRDASAALGWQAVGAFDPAPGTLTVTVHDSADLPVDGASVIVRAFHRARRTDAVTLALAESAAGSYACPLQGPRPGWWSIWVDAARGEDRFHTELIVEVSADGSND
jgi:nitrogen fixation protein FixH